MDTRRSEVRVVVVVMLSALTSIVSMAQSSTDPLWQGFEKSTEFCAAPRVVAWDERKHHQRRD